MVKKSAPDTLDVFAYNEFVDRFHAESDRAAAVLAGAYLDTFLENALRSLMVPGRRVDEMFAGQGPLQSFGNKIAMACGLGLVADDLAREMDLIRKVRNHFAHHIWEASFERAPVSDWCNELRIVDSAVNERGEPVKDRNPPRLRYLLAVGMATLSIAHSPKVPAHFHGFTAELRSAGT